MIKRNTRIIGEKKFSNNTFSESVEWGKMFTNGLNIEEDEGKTNKQTKEIHRRQGKELMGLC